MNSPPPLPPSLACLCPIKDYAVMSGVSQIDEGRLVPIADGQTISLIYAAHDRATTPINYSTTSSSSKFAFQAFGGPLPDTLVYTPVFTGNSPAAITGAFSASLDFHLNTPSDFLLDFSIVWSNDGFVASLNTITQSEVKIVSNPTTPDRFTFSLPYAVSFTKAQMSAAGSVSLRIFITVTRSTTGVTYGTYDITITATEV